MRNFGQRSEPSAELGREGNKPCTGVAPPAYFRCALSPTKEAVHGYNLLFRVSEKRFRWKFFWGGRSDLKAK